MLFLATVALLAVGAEISARSSSRESVRPPCPAGMIRAGNAVRTGYSADKVHGVRENLRIEKDSVRTDVYRILLWDNFNRKYRKAELLLRHGEDGYRIDGILSLPDRYTRDPD